MTSGWVVFLLGMGRWVAFLLAVIFSTAGVAAGMPVRLRCNYLDRPLGIDSVHPRLSWQSDSVENGWRQESYEILVATTAERAVSGKADVWDSGRQRSAVSVDVVYGGPKLESRRRYFWSVVVWDAAGRVSSAVRAAWWEMGLLEASDWSAQWVGGVDRTAKETAGLRWIWLAGEDAFKTASREKASFRTEVDLEKKPLRALLSVAGRGDYAVSVNGYQTGMKKDWTAFDLEDIADHLRVGKNEILIDVTAPAGRRGAAGSNAAAPPVVAGVAAVLHLTAPDGATRRITTADGWQASSDGAGGWKPAQVVAELNDPRMGANPGLPPHAAALLRDRFELTKTISQARLYVTAAGSYRMSINGRRVGETALTPDFTDYRKHVPYQTYDVTPLVVRGENAIGAILGDGWYESPMMWNGVHAFSGPVRLLAELEVRYSDGSGETISTSPGWKTADSPIVGSTIYAGEMYDARLEQKGWDTASFRDAAWKPAVAQAAPEGVVSAQIGSPVHLEKTLPAKSVKQLASGDWLFDMGQNMVGWTTLRVSGPAGAKVKMRFAERLNPDGSIYTENLRNAEAADIYTLRGGGLETFAPHFTFHGFQYVQVSGLPMKPTVATLTGEVLNSLEGEPSGRLMTSSPLLNRMWNLGIWGQRGNFLSIPTDCPQRDERLGWMGDAGVFWRTGAYNFDIAAFSAKFMQDIVDAQTPAGAFSDISPNLMGRGTGAPGWGDAGIIVPYTTWLQYGDRSIVEENWAAMERWMDFIEKSNPNFLREKELGANYADWLAPDQGTSKALVATAYWAIVAGMMRDMAKATGHDEVKYAAVYEQVREAYRKAYVGADGSVAGETQTSYLLTLYAGLAPEKMRAAMTDRLVANIKAHDGHLTTGFLGTPFLLFALSENGRTEAAYDLLLQETYPSWGYMVSKGATTWWERWNGDSGDPAMNSYNHYSFGSVLAWVYRDVAGIDTDVEHPGFQHIDLHPSFSKRLQFARGEYDSAYGKIVSDWKRMPSGKIEWTVKIPANASASVPVSKAYTVRAMGAGASKAAGGSAVALGSGTYRFEVSESGT